MNQPPGPDAEPGDSEPSNAEPTPPPVRMPNPVVPTPGQAPPASVAPPGQPASPGLGQHAVDSAGAGQAGAAHAGGTGGGVGQLASDVASGAPALRDQPGQQVYDAGRGDGSAQPAGYDPGRAATHDQGRGAHQQPQDLGRADGSGQQANVDPGKAASQDHGRGHLDQPPDLSRADGSSQHTNLDPSRAASQDHGRGHLDHSQGPDLSRADGSSQQVSFDPSRSSGYNPPPAHGDGGVSGQLLGEGAGQAAGGAGAAASGAAAAGGAASGAGAAATGAAAAGGAAAAAGGAAVAASHLIPAALAGAVFLGAAATVVVVSPDGYRSPGDTVEQFIDAAQAGDKVEVAQLVCADMLNDEFNEMTPAELRMINILGPVEVVGERIDGTTATVWVMIPDTGEVESYPTELIVENGEWKLCE